MGEKQREKQTRPDTRQKMRLVCVLSTFENNWGRTDRPTDGETDGVGSAMSKGAIVHLIALLLFRVFFFLYSLYLCYMFPHVNKLDI